jgi:hypothetical protein
MYNFGVGTIIGVRNDITNAQPALLGVAQDIEVNFDRTLKELLGQNQFPVAIAASSCKISGKAKFANIKAANFNNLFLGQSIVTGTQTFMPPLGEAHTVATTTQQVTNHATFVADLGVAYASTGQFLQPVAPGSEAAGKYSVNVATGTYTFNSADEVALLFFYSYTASSGVNIPIANIPMGQQPTFQLNLQEQFTQVGGAKTMYLTLNACVSGKLNFPFKNTDFTIMEMDFEAFADNAGNVGNFSFTE